MKEIDDEEMENEDKKIPEDAEMENEEEVVLRPIETRTTGP